jgi:ferredoxin
MVISAIAQKGYRVFYDRAFMMPSNWLMKYPQEFNRQLCDAARAKMKSMVPALLAGEKRNIPYNPLLARVAYFLWLFEDFGTRFFGIDLYANKACTLCEKCISECPMGNISKPKSRIKFGWNCVWCMHCVYSCPTKAIRTHFQNFVILKDGYDITKSINASKQDGDPLSDQSNKMIAKNRDYLADPAM